MSNLSFHIISTKDFSTAHRKLYLETYNTFKETWEEAFTEIFGQEYKFTANDFTRQDYIQAIFKDNECIALDCIRKANIFNPADIDDSWLSYWSKDQISEIQSLTKGEILINSYFTVKKSHRKTFSSDGHHIGYLMGCLSFLDQVEKGYDVVLGMMRNGRSMNALGKRWGSRTMQENVLVNNEPTDLVIFEKDNVIEASKTFPEIAFELYRNQNSIDQNELLHKIVAA